MNAGAFHFKRQTAHIRQLRWPCCALSWTTSRCSKPGDQVMVT